MLTEMTEAIKAFGGKIEWYYTQSGPAYIVTGPKTQVAGLVTEQGFSIKAWAESLQARVM